MHLCGKLAASNTTWPARYTRFRMDYRRGLQTIMPSQLSSGLASSTRPFNATLSDQRHDRVTSLDQIDTETLVAPNARFAAHACISATSACRQRLYSQRPNETRLHASISTERRAACPPEAGQPGVASGSQRLANYLRLPCQLPICWPAVICQFDVPSGTSGRSGVAFGAVPIVAARAPPIQLHRAPVRTFPPARDRRARVPGDCLRMSRCSMSIDDTTKCSALLNPSANAAAPAVPRSAPR